MCPVCLATALLIVGGAASTGGGLAALAMKKFHARDATPPLLEGAGLADCPSPKEGVL